MTLVDMETFGSKEVAIVYIAGQLGESKRVEQVLSENAIDYAIAFETFEKRVLGIFRVEYKGVGFYVSYDQSDLCYRVLREAGLVRGLVGDNFD